MLSEPVDSTHPDTQGVGNAVWAGLRRRDEEYQQHVLTDRRNLRTTYRNARWPVEGVGLAIIEGDGRGRWLRVVDTSNHSDEPLTGREAWQKLMRKAASTDATERTNRVGSERCCLSRVVANDRRAQYKMISPRTATAVLSVRMTYIG
jgi:hypothetical protein